MLKRIFTILMALVMGLQPLAASASNLEQAFSDLLGGAPVSANGPGYFQSGARNSFTAGGLELRVPKKSTSAQLFTFTPPRIEKGCGGISAHFGGFSFISGPEFTQLLKNIGSGVALGFVTQLAIATLCPKCEDVINKLKDAAQFAARLSIDSCKLGQQLAVAMMSGSIPNGEPSRLCSTTTSNEGGGSDFMSTYFGDTCKSVSSAWNGLMNSSAASTPEAKAQLQCEAGGGNITWANLKAFDQEGLGAAEGNTPGYQRKIILMNLMGVQLNFAKGDGVTQPSCEGEVGTVAPTEQEQEKYCAPRVDMSMFVGLFMCGSPSESGDFPGLTSTRIKEYCRDYFVKQGSRTNGGKMFNCAADGAGSAKETCNKVVYEDMGQVLVNSQGFVTQVNKLLTDGANAVRSNQPLGQDVIRLMQVAPVPLYQAVNAAAVYPSAAMDLLESMSVLVAEQIAYSYFDEMLRLTGRDIGQQKGCLSKDTAKGIMETLQNMRNMNLAAKDAIGKNFATQQAMNEQIRRINLVIQQQVLSQDMLMTGQYSQQITRTLTPAPKGNGAGSTP